MVMIPCDFTKVTLIWDHISKPCLGLKSPLGSLSTGLEYVAPCIKFLLTDIHKLLRIYLKIPVNTSTVK